MCVSITKSRSLCNLYVSLTHRIKLLTTCATQATADRFWTEHRLHAGLAHVVDWTKIQEMSLLWWLKYSDRQLVICVSNSEFDHNLSSYFSLSIYPDMSISSFCCSWALKCVLSEKWLTLEIVVVKAALTQLPPWFDAMTAENWSHPICTQQYNDYMCNMKQKHAT